MHFMPTGDVIASPPQPFQSVLDAVACGDREVSQKLVEDWHAVITVVAEGIASNPLALDEMKQAGRMAVLKSARQYNVGAGVPFAHYVKRAIRNACLRVLEDGRSRDEQIPTAMMADGDRRSSVITSPLERLILADSVIGVREFVLGLPPALRAVFDQIYVHGRTQREAAAALGVSQPWVARLHRQMKDLGVKQLASYN